VKVYGPREIADLLDMQSSTLRKYSVLLESYGYEIERNSRGHRFYRDKDIMTLRSVITCMDSGVTLDESVKQVVKHKGNNGYRHHISNDTDQYSSDMQEIKGMVQQQSDLIHELTKRLDEQQKYIDESLIERDRQLTNTMHELLEDKKQLAEHKDNRGFIARLFNINN